MRKESSVACTQGILGNLSQFSIEFLPKVFLEERRPLNLRSWEHHYEVAVEAALREVDKIHSMADPGALLNLPDHNLEEDEFSEYGGGFLLGLMLTDQVDVVNTLVVDLQWDLGQHSRVWSLHLSRNAKL